MLNHINVRYSTTGDFTFLNPSVYVPINKTYNLILLPINEESKDLMALEPSDTIKLFNKTLNSYTTHKIALSCGMVRLKEQDYYYFYICKGLSLAPSYQNESPISLSYKHHQIDLKTHLDSSYSAKLLMGLVVLPDDLSYMYTVGNNLIFDIDGSIVKGKLIDINNKFNYYMANKNNTLLYILDDTNYDLLYSLNESSVRQIFVKPHYYTNFPLGSFTIDIDDKGVSNTEDGPKYKLFFNTDNNNTHYLINNSLKIIDLPSNNYSVRIIDRNGLVKIGLCNGVSIDADTFNVHIPKIQDSYDLSTAFVPQFSRNISPNIGLANLMINLVPSDKPFELLGPNQFYKKYNSGGSKVLSNINSGKYSIVQEGYTRDFFVVKNDNNYISNIK